MKVFISFLLLSLCWTVEPKCPDLRSARANQDRKVAIIGGGPSGTSAAYFLSTAQPPNSSIGVTLFERERIGGRTAVAYPYDDPTFEPVELGASIYAEANLNLRRAVKQFELQTGAQNGIDGQIGIWDGQQFLFEADGASWWTSAKVLFRYGLGPVRAQALVKKQLGYFAGLYDPKFLHYPDGRGGTQSGFPWESIEHLAHAVNASDLAGQTAKNFFYKENGISDLFVEEMIEAATRVNYAQDTDQIHGFGGLVSLAASGAEGVLGGNYLIFDQFLKRSGAKVKLGDEGTVTGLVKFESLREAIKSGKITCREAVKYGWRDDDAAKWWVGTKDGEGELFDAVIIATPWHNADITLMNTDKRVAAPPYVHLHVTLVATNASGVNPEYFGRGKGDAVPVTILTSDESVRRAKADPLHLLKTPKLEFHSLNFLRPLRHLDGETSTSRGKEYIVKIFSMSPMTDAKLGELLGSDKIGWTYRKEWDAYPYLSPTTKFPKVKVDEGLYFPNAMERLVSTMETSTVSARNTVGLLLQEWYGSDFVNGGEDCPWKSSEEEDELGNPDWAGWGCRSG